MVGGSVQQQHVGVEQHHPGKHTAHLFAAGQHLYRLVDIVAGEQHSPQESPEEGLGLVCGGILPDPVQDGVVIIVEISGIVHREVRSRGRNAPLERTLVRLFLFHEDLEQHGDRLLALADKRHLVGASQGKADVVQQFHAVHRLGNAVDLEDFLAQFPIHIESDKRIAAAGCRQFLYGQIIQQFPA